MRDTIDNAVICMNRLRKDVIFPTKRDEDGWYDLYANFEAPTCTFLPGVIKLVPTGIVSAFDKKYRIKFGERGSNSKTSLSVMCGHIDSGFRGEWFVALLNVSNKPVIISKEATEISYNEYGTIVPYNKAICQFGVEIVPDVVLMETSYEQIMSMASERMETCLGQSGK